MTTFQEYIQNGVPQAVASALTAYADGRNNAFIFHFNILDYVLSDKPVKLTDYLVMSMRNQDVIVMYDPGRGLRFPDLLDQNGKGRAKSMEETFRRVVGLDKPAGNNPLAGLNLGNAPVSNEPPPLPRQPEQVLPLLETLAKSKDTSAVILLEYIELVIPAAQNAMMQPPDRLALMTLSRWGNDPAFNSPVFMITENLEDLHPMIRAASRHWHTIEIPLPDYERRLRFIETWTEGRSEFTIEKGLTMPDLARATAGLTLIGIEDIFLQANGLGVLNYEMVHSMKKAIVETEFAGLVEFVDPRISFNEIGGLWHVKDYFKENVISPIRKGIKEIVPMGVMLLGPAGTGKTVTAEAVAHESGINMLILRIGGQIASMWQGEGERNLRKVLAAAKQFTPCLIFIDEIDQTVSRGGGAGGNQQESRIFQMLLEFMSDTTHRGEVVFVAATNRPDLMDAALKRPGRFDDKLLFPVPEADERADLLKVMIKKYGLGKLKEVPQAVIARTEKWTGAEIESIARKAKKLILLKGQKIEEALINAAHSINPVTQDVQFMTLLAIKECQSDLDYLPEKYRKQAESPETLEADIASLQAETPQYRGKRKI